MKMFRMADFLGRTVHSDYYFMKTFTVVFLKSLLKRKLNVANLDRLNSNLRNSLHSTEPLVNTG